MDSPFLELNSYLCVFASEYVAFEQIALPSQSLERKKYHKFA